ncbi:nitrile hydratase subunit alpha [Actinomycetospora chibensis]|uniref:nitrile hydratase n=1 Tax=Actinomycetospora chibensis TaxID=663606 RepID=A0ABV9RQI9_9PSEU|nr:nitrile hydratase subunit alpha [Actinomycetospora chibensis]MDD7926589.1 nitrile hydratase subunit alpha [Actinomycetospora chibensis]
MNAPAGDISRRLSPALRTEALEQLLVERELIDPAVMDKFITTYERDVGPLNGAKVVARAWTDPEYREWLLRDGTAAIKDMGFSGPQGEHMVVLEQSDDVHHVVVCTLCSCYPWPILGLPPSWYKDPAYRAGIVRTPRRVLGEMGLDVPEGKDIQVWDSSTEVRYLVLPQRPTGTEGWDAEALAGIVTRDAMVGVALVSTVSAP